MTATLAPRSWPAPPPSGRDGSWLFAREQQSPPGWLFDLRRNVSLTPRQLLQAYAILCGVSIAVAVGFWWQGVAMVAAFTGVELLAVGLAMLVVARHAGDRELITLCCGRVSVEQRCGPSVQHTLFRAEWLRVEPAAADGSLVELSGEGRSVRVGRHVRPELRVALAQELRRTLRLARSATERAVDHEPQA